MENPPKCTRIHLENYKKNHLCPASSATVCCKENNIISLFYCKSIQRNFCHASNIVEQFNSRGRHFSRDSSMRRKSQEKSLRSIKSTFVYEASYLKCFCFRQNLCIYFVFMSCFLYCVCAGFQMKVLIKVKAMHLWFLLTLTCLYLVQL